MDILHNAASHNYINSGYFGFICERIWSSAIHKTCRSGWLNAKVTLVQ